MPAAVIATAYGGPEVLSVIDEPVPEPGPGQVRIAVRAAGVNPVDWKMYSARPGADPALLPIRVGLEAAGVVSAAGPDHLARVGDEVIAFRAPGAYACELVVPATSLVPKPASLSWPAAAGLMLAGVTAWHCLVAARVAAGDIVLVHGGSGGVGAMAVQLAVLRGATVVATASPARHEILRGLGAVPVAYGPGLAGRVRAAVPGRVDVALDMVGTDEAVDVSLELVADRARIISIAAWARGQRDGITTLGGGPGADPGTEIRAAARPELARLAGEGSVTVHVTQTFPLGQAAAAHRAIMSGHTAGKIILIP